VKTVKTWSTPAGAAEQSIPVPCELCGGGVFVPYWTCETDGAVFSYVRCVSCGLVQINPQPSREAVHGRYGKSHGEDYLSYELANEAAFLRLQELALRDAGFFEEEKAAKPGRIIDAGCATGALLSTLAARGWEVQGVEISGQQAEYCRKRGLKVSSLPLEENAFPPEYFNAVHASHLIEHLNRPAAFAAEAYRILKPGGCLYLTTPNIAGLQARLFGPRWRSAIFDHLYLFSRASLSALLCRAGFRVERCRTWGGLAAGLAPAPVKAVFDRAAKVLGFGDVMIMRARKP
jgi:2-polyprenyl-3-methyl-5-hydroxy-6-metoxy-1,4-benzoquinol methylase